VQYATDSGEAELDLVKATLRNAASILARAMTGHTSMAAGAA
jgi:hypothetical protein